MDFENLQRELFERKLKIGEYFKTSFEVWKIFMKKNKMVVSLLIIANVCILFFNFLQQNIGLEIKVASRVRDAAGVMRGSMLSLLISLGILIISAGVGLIGAIVYSKVTYEIEDRESEYKFKNVAFKYLKFTGVYLLLLLCIGIIVILLVILGIILLILAKNSETKFFEYLALGVPLAIYIIIIFLIALNVLYFIQIFYARDMTVIDTFKYNLRISKTNRLRILIPQLLLGLINCIFIISFSTKMFIFMPSYIVFFISIICGIISTALGLIGIVMSVIIFLNVEYNYLKSIDKKQKED